MQPLVSIIVPTYNRASLISDTIESILIQSYTNWELIIVDDHSSDNTLEVVSKYLQADKRIKFFLRPSDRLQGGNASRNFGLERSNGDYVLWLDSDDLLAKTYLCDQLLLILDRQADVVICRTKIFRELNELKNSEQLEEWGSLDGQQSIKDFLNFRLYWHTGAPLWKKSMFKDWKPFDEELLNSQEWLMHLESLLKKPNIVFNNNFLWLCKVP